MIQNISGLAGGDILDELGAVLRFEKGHTSCGNAKDGDEVLREDRKAHVDRMRHCCTERRRLRHDLRFRCRKHVKNEVADDSQQQTDPPRKQGKQADDIFERAGFAAAGHWR